MNRQCEITDRNCLLVFDPHQDVAWMRSVIELQGPRVNHLLLGGDYFDTGRGADVASVAETCAYLNELISTWGDNLTVLLGNHDVHYYEAKRWCDLHRTPRQLNYKCSGFTATKAKTIAKRIVPEFWPSCRLFQAVNGWLISHAGLAGCYWPAAPTVAESLRAFDTQCADIVKRIPFSSFPLLQAGKARGGEQEIGGLTWLDFNFEFSDDEIPLPQIVGHTTSKSGARRNGRSWCLDGAQQCHGILHPDGRLEVVGPVRED